MSDVLRVGNCSGFYGDRFGAMREMLAGGELADCWRSPGPPGSRR